MNATGVSASPTIRTAVTTPLMRQYMGIKQEHPDAFLFFRLGDFYEMFFEDAVAAASLLGLTLTSRNKQDPEPIPMCGIPWHQRDAYVARLLRLGHKVAICDQLEDPSQAKGIVQRGVTEILTPGSVTQDGFLEPSSTNYLAALWPGGLRLGVCVCDASTGEVRLAAPDWAEAPELLARLRVSEWLYPSSEDGAARVGRIAALLRGQRGAMTPLPAARFEDAGLLPGRWGEAALVAHASMPESLAAATGAVDYLDRVQGGAALQLRAPEAWLDDDALRYDAATARHLELFQPGPGGEPAHTLWHHVNQTISPGGARRLRAWIERPLSRPAAIGARLDAVGGWVEDSVTRAAFRQALRGFPDLERLSSRVACGKATPRDLGAIRDALERLPALRDALGDRSGFPSNLAGASELRALLSAALVDDPPPVSRDGGIIRPGHDAARDRLADLAHSGKRWIAELETSERERTGIPSLKVGYNRVFGYYLEVTRSHRDRVPADYERRQTLANAERFVTPGLKLKEGEVLGAEDKLRSLEHELFLTLRERSATHVAALQSIADALAGHDALAALGEAAARFGWTRPVVDDSDRFVAEDARHPVVERLLPAGAFVPNRIELDGATRQILLLTGPNMGGKSTYLRQIALIALLAQAGSYVPAASARIGAVDRLFTRVGSADRLGAGQSTFMVEMEETASILRSATARSLVLLDELGRGTATFDGLALAWAVTEHLHTSMRRPRTLFATHYHELTQLESRLERLRNIHVEVRERGEQVVFLHRVVEGAADRSYGIQVARLAGLPASVLTRAEEVLAELESERTVEHLSEGSVERLESHASSSAVAAARRGPARSESTPQLGLFGPPEHPLLAELRALDPDRMTPFEALERLAAWRKRWGSEAP